MVTNPNGYRLVIPPGWVRIPLREGTEAALEDLVFARLRDLPPDVPKDDGMKYRLAVRRSLTRRIAEAREAGGLDLYLPLTARYGMPLAASFLVSEHPVGEESGPVSEPFVRNERVCPADPEGDVPVATRRVEYVLPVPGDPGRLVTVVYSTAGDGDPESRFTTALVELFDAGMLTFRWTRDGTDPIALEGISR